MAQVNQDIRRERGFILPQWGSVLLVDEDHAGLLYYSFIFRSFGCQVRSCASYQEAERLLSCDAYDLVVVSQGSPKFEGRHVLERAIQIDRRMRVLVVARTLDIPCYIEAMQLGAVDYLAEPVTEQELRRVAESHLRLEPLRPRSSFGKRHPLGSQPV